MSNDEKGLRFNKGKIELSQCPTSLVAAVAFNLMRNSTKYGGKYPDNNWRKGMSWTTVVNCLQRHLEDFKNGVDIDPEDGIPTMWKVATNAAFLIEYAQTCPELDDRYKGKQVSLHDFPKFEDSSKKTVKKHTCDSCSKCTNNLKEDLCSSNNGNEDVDENSALKSFKLGC